MSDYYPDCPVCGEPIDYCLGHGEVLDLNDGGEYVSPSKEEFVRRLLGQTFAEFFTER